MKIAFWGYKPGSCRVTASAVALSCYAGAVKGKTSGLFQLSSSWENNLQTPFLDVSLLSAENFQNTGIDSLLRVVKTGDNNADAYITTSFSFIEKKVNMYVPTLTDNLAGYYKDMYENLEGTFDALDRVSDLVICDAGSDAGVQIGKGDPLNIKALSLADVIVICLPQDITRIKYFFDNIHINNSKFLYLITDYYDEKSTTLTTLKKRFPKLLKDKNLACLHHNIEFSDALEASKISRYFLTNTEPSKKDNAYSFIKDCETIYNKINRINLGK